MSSHLTSWEEILHAFDSLITEDENERLRKSIFVKSANYLSQHRSIELWYCVLDPYGRFQVSPFRGCWATKEGEFSILISRFMVPDDLPFVEASLLGYFNETLEKVRLDNENFEVELNRLILLLKSKINKKGNP